MKPGPMTVAVAMTLLLSARGILPAQATRPASTVPSPQLQTAAATRSTMEDLRRAVSDAADKLDKARAQADQALKTNPDYLRLKGAAAAAQTARESLGADSTIEQRIAASAEMSRSKREMDDFAMGFMAERAEIRLAKANLAQAQADLSVAEDARKSRAAAEEQFRASAANAKAQAGRGFDVGPVRIQLVQARTARVPLQLGGRLDGYSSDQFLVIDIGLINQSDTKKVDYEPWNPDIITHGRIATLTDDLGNHYKRIDFGLDRPVGNIESSDSIYPGKALLDVLVFEPPVARATMMTLHLPKVNVGGEGEGILEIPAAGLPLADKQDEANTDAPGGGMSLKGISLHSEQKDPLIGMTIRQLRAIPDSMLELVEDGVESRIYRLSVGHVTEYTTQTVRDFANVSHTERVVTGSHWTSVRQLTVDPQKGVVISVK